MINHSPLMSAIRLETMWECLYKNQDNQASQWPSSIKIGILIDQLMFFKKITSILHFS